MLAVIARFDWYRLRVPTILACSRTLMSASLQTERAANRIFNRLTGDIGIKRRHKDRVDRTTIYWVTICQTWSILAFSLICAKIPKSKITLEIRQTSNLRRSSARFTPSSSYWRRPSCDIKRAVIGPLLTELRHVTNYRSISSYRENTEKTKYAYKFTKNPIFALARRS